MEENLTLTWEEGRYGTFTAQAGKLISCLVEWSTDRNRPGYVAKVNYVRLFPSKDRHWDSVASAKQACENFVFKELREVLATMEAKAKEGSKHGKRADHVGVNVTG